MAHKGNMERWQTKILLLCWAAYAAAYMVRTNISVALPGMTSEFHLNNTTSGMVGSAFFWAYAVGQLINGYIGDRFNSRYFIFIGLFMSATINFAVGTISDFYIILILWAINGLFLSMLWGPIVKTVSVWFPEEKRTDVSVILSFSMMGGYLFSWGFVGESISAISWRFAFYIPAAIVLIYSFIWIAKMRSRPEDVGLKLPVKWENKDPGVGPAVPSVRLRTIFLNGNLKMIVIASFVQGFVKDGISLWAPTFLKSTQRISTSEASMISLVIPIMSMAGIFCSRWLSRVFHNNERKAVSVLYLISAVSGFLLFAFLNAGVVVTAILLSIIEACMYGANTLLLTIVPLRFSFCNRVSTVAGILDFISYIGAAVAGIFTGVVSDTMGWKFVAVTWAILSVIGMASLLFGERMKPSMPGT